MWMNSAETYIDILDNFKGRNEDAGDFEDRLVTWVSESGMLEFFLLANSNEDQNAPKRLMYKQNLISGFSPLPPYYALGFHYSKWETITTDSLISLVNTFNSQNMPLDVLWLDIEYADQKKYFAFDESKFKNVDALVQKMSNEQKRLTIITDPHISLDYNYFVYNKGKEIVLGHDKDGNKIEGAFVRDSTQVQSFVGDCWPG